MRLFGTDDKGRPIELAPAPAVNAGFEERDATTFHIPPGGPWTLRIDDEPLSPSGNGWLWAPGFFAGEVTARLAGPDGTAYEYLLDVSPDREKLGRDHFARLLEEVAADDPVFLAGDEPATVLTRSEHLSEDPLLALVAFARMRVHVGPFLRAITEVSRRPRTGLRQGRTWVPIQQARRLDLRSVRTALLSPDVTSALSETGTALPRNPSALRLDVPVNEVTLDTAANHCLRALLLAVRQRARATSELLVLLAKRQESDTRTSLAARLPVRLELLERMAGDVAAVLRQRPWVDVSRAEITAAGLTAVASDPAYARAFQLGWKALRTGMGGLGGEDRLWLSPTWELFERWCFVRLTRQLQRLLPDLQWERLTAPYASGRALAEWRGTGGGTRVRLLLQPMFPSGDQKDCDGFRSISRQRFPDLVLTHERDGDGRFVVLDAKYRRGRQAILEEMSVAHTYRDSLRWNGQRSQAAYLLLPAACEAGWLSEEGFRRTERVGVLTLEDELDPVVRELLVVTSARQ
jgi:hypothetical protein